MVTLRPEVQALIRATECLLSPITLGEELSRDEREMVGMCAENLLQKYPVTAMEDQNPDGLHQSRHATKKSRAVINRTRVDFQVSGEAIEQVKQRISKSRNR
jgi:hypothetical protein